MPLAAYLVRRRLHGVQRLRQLVEAEDSEYAAPFERQGGMSQSWARPDGECVNLPMPLLPVDLNNAKRVWDSALCAEVDPELFFPTPGDLGHATAATAKAVCAACDVRALCLETFGPLLDNGVVGGKSAVERRGMRKERRARKDAA